MQVYIFSSSLRDFSRSNFKFFVFTEQMLFFLINIVIKFVIILIFRTLIKFDDSFHLNKKVSIFSCRFIQGESWETDVFKEDKTLQIFKQKFIIIHKSLYLNYAIMEYFG